MLFNLAYNLECIQPNTKFKKQLSELQPINTIENDNKTTIQQELSLVCFILNQLLIIG